MQKLSQLEGIGVKFSELLQQEGINDQKQLLIACRDCARREALAQKTGINLKLILKWTSQADLSRIHGIGEAYAELLEQTGVDSTRMLAQSHAESLLNQLKSVNEKNNWVRHTPSLSQIESWIAQSKKLPQLLSD